MPRMTEGGAIRSGRRPVFFLRIPWFTFVVILKVFAFVVPIFGLWKAGVLVSELLIPFDFMFDGSFVFV